jgi:hypothetical protein
MILRIKNSGFSDRQAGANYCTVIISSDSTDVTVGAIFN